MGQLLLGKIIEKIGLVLGCIPGPAEKIPAGVRIPADPGIVAGGNIVTAPVHGFLQHQTELHGAVAVDAGVGGKARLIAGDEVIDDVFPELRLAVDDHMGDLQLVTDGSGIPAVSLFPQVHGGSHAVKGCLF